MKLPRKFIVIDNPLADQNAGEKNNKFEYQIVTLSGVERN
jgi:hypothetical protein